MPIEAGPVVEYLPAETKQPSLAALWLTVAIVIGLVLGAAALTHCDPTPTPAPVAVDCSHVPAGFDGCGMQWTAYTGTETLFKPGADKVAIAFSRVQVDIEGAFGSRVFGRAELGARPDTTTGSSWTSAEGTLGAYRQVGGLVAVAGAYGYSIALDKDVANAPSRTYGGGLMLGDPRGRRWLLVLAGRCESTGPGLATIWAGQWPLVGATYAVGDGAFNKVGSFARVGVAVRLP